MGLALGYLAEVLGAEGDVAYPCEGGATQGSSGIVVTTPIGQQLLGPSARPSEIVRVVGRAASFRRDDQAAP